MDEKDEKLIEEISKQKIYLWSGEEVAYTFRLLASFAEDLKDLKKRIKVLENK
jgi:hypothetical protein